MIRSIAARLIAASLMLAIAGSSHAQPSSQRALLNANDLYVAMTLFYEKPSDVLTLLQSWEKLPVREQPIMIGFLAGLFHKHPNEMSKLTSVSNLGQDAQLVVIQGMRLVGRLPEARQAATAWGWSADQVARITPITPLRENKTTTAEGFVPRWSASYASGDAIYVRPILDLFNAGIQNAGIDPQEVVALALAQQRRDQTLPRELEKKYPPETFRQLLVLKLALWALESNARLHKFIATALDAWLAEKSNAPAAKALSDLRQKMASPR